MDQRQTSVSVPKMYEDSGNNCFDPNAMMVQGTTTEDCYSQINSESAMTHTSATETNHNNSFAENVGLSMEIISSYPYSCGDQEDHAIIATTTATTNAAATAMELGFHMENNNPYNNSTAHLVEEVTNNNDHGSSQDLSFDQSDQGHHQDRQFPSYPKPTPDLLNFLHLSPTSSSLGNSSISFENSPHNTITNLPKVPSCNGTWVGNNDNCPMGVSYDPFLHLNLPAPSPLFQSLVSHGYNVPDASRNDFVFGGGGNDIEGSGIASYQDFENGVLEFSQEVGGYVGKKRRGKSTKQFTSTTERQRRVDLGGKFDALKDLIPNPSKSDRASVVGDAIDYIKELLRTVNELKILVEKKSYEKQRMMKRQKVEEGNACTEGDLMNPANNHSYNESLRSSWIQRKSKDTEIDVRIIDNEVTIKLVQRKKINCLVYASQVMDELKLDLQHVAGGYIGDFSSFMFNSKICEGSSVYASAIANKLIEIMDRSLAAA